MVTGLQDGGPVALRDFGEHPVHVKQERLVPKRR
jgi:nucleoid DNA-binding protein